MNVVEARKLVRRRLTERGLKTIRRPLSPKLWCRTVEEVTPYYSPAVYRVGRWVHLCGSIGIYITEFELLWHQLWRRYCPEDRWDDSSLFSISVDNIKQFRSPPAILADSKESIIREEQWLDAVLMAVDEMPKSLSSVIGQLKKNRLGRYPANCIDGHFVRRRVFVRWLQENSYDIPEIEVRQPVWLISTILEPILRRLEDDKPLSEL